MKAARFPSISFKPLSLVARRGAELRGGGGMAGAGAPVHVCVWRRTTSSHLTRPSSGCFQLSPNKVSVTAAPYLCILTSDYSSRLWHNVHRYPSSARLMRETSSWNRFFCQRSRCGARRGRSSQQRVRQCESRVDLLFLTWRPQ